MKLLGLEMQVEEIVKINEDEQNALLRTFAKLSTSIRVEIMANHRKLVYKIKQLHRETSISVLSYSSLLLAIQIHKTNQDKANRLNISNLSLDEIRDITSKKAKVFLNKKFRKQTKRERLLSYWAIVKTLKYDEKFSFRKIAIYLKKYHKCDVSYSLIAKIWDNLENKRI